MSNPLAAFRKHQNVLLAVFGVVIMLSFAVGPIIQGCQRNSGGPSAGTTQVVKYQNGTISESDLSQMRFARQVLIRYMDTIGQIAATRGASVGRTVIPRRYDETSLVETRLMAEEAARQGIAVDQQEINRFLQQYTGNQLKTDELAGLLQDVTNGRMSENQFFSSMQQHLMAARYGGLISQGLVSSSPSSMWDYFQRLNRRVEAELVAYPVTNYASSDPIPDSELRAAYEQGKNRFVNPADPLPAFKQLKRVAVSYVKCSRTSFVEAEKAAITEADIVAYYETNKEKFRNETLPPVSDVETSTDSDLDSNATSVDETGLPADTPATDDNVGTEGSGDVSIPDEIIVEDVNEDDIGTSTDEPNDEASGCGPQEEPEEDTSTEPVEEDADQDEGTSDDTASEDTPSDDSAADDTTSSDASTNDEANEDASETAPADATDTAADDAKSTADDSAAAEVTTAESPSEQPANDENASDDVGSGDDIANLPDEPELPEFQPLEEVRDKIISNIASERAEPKYTAAKSRVETAMSVFFRDHTAWTIEVNGGNKTAEPTPPDLALLAAQNNFTAGSVPLVNAYELQERDPITDLPVHEIGASFDISETGIVFFSQQIYAEELRKYDPKGIRGAELSQGTGLTEYVYWKTDETPATTPSFEECKADVEAFVRRSKAVSVARAAIEKEAASISSTGKSLSEHFADRPNTKVIESGVFSWMKMSAQQRPALGQVPGVRFAGHEFMKDVFALKQGEYGVAFDAPRKTVYLVYLKQDLETPEALREIYARTGPTMDTFAVQQDDAMLRINGWYNDFLEGQRLEWLRQPR
ncbi:MAG: SurA N-terminal domain-containing protein [Planctomycetales bacterium]|nr:SurA N-terminal domain-containing protein [Planctomycetales bacterium]